MDLDKKNPKPTVLFLVVKWAFTKNQYTKYEFSMTYKYSFDYSCQLSRHISYIYIIIVLGNKRACLCMTYGQSFRGNGSKQSLK